MRSNPYLATPEAGAEVDVILPVHNAASQLAACLVSIARHTTRPFHLTVIDDASTEPAIGELLDAVAIEVPGVIVLRHAENRGFTRVVNDGLIRSTAPNLVVLNSDTIVTPRWLDKLVSAARSRPNVATVTPLTNNGSICSVPDLSRANEIPSGYSVDTFAELVERRSLNLLPEAPTGVGFCMLITRAALEQVGDLDAESFGRGYGEENDFCQRAIRSGFVNLIADDTFVYHEGRASFGASGDPLLRVNLATLERRYPAYPSDVAAFYQDDPLRTFRADLAATAQRLAGSPAARPVRVLHLLHRGGGTEKHARELASTTNSDLVSYVSCSDGRALEIDEYSAGAKRRTWSFPVDDAPAPLLPGRRVSYRHALMAACLALRIDLIHVHHLLNNTLDIADVASAASIPYVLTLHDYYLLCPTYTLLDPAGQPCGACIGRKPIASAVDCIQHLGQPAFDIVEYQHHTQRFMKDAAAVFAPNVRVREIFASRFPDLAARIAVVEHGHPTTASCPADALDSAVALSDASPLAVAVIGGLEPHKGLAAFRDLLRAGADERIVFHVYGWTPDPALRGRPNEAQRIDGSRVVYHGPYASDEIVAKLKTDRIHVGLLLAAWEEAFSYTLSEFVAAGIPVIARDLGAPAERIRRCHLGWIVPAAQPAEAILDLLRRLLAQPSVLTDAARAMRRELALPSLEAMWAQYADAYQRIPALQGEAMNQDPTPADALFSRDYVSFLARRQVRDPQSDAQLLDALARVQSEADALRQRLRSPRHRVADAAAGFLQKIPIVWPLVAKATDAVLRRQSRG